MGGGPKLRRRLALLCVCCSGVAGGVGAQSGSVTLSSRETTLKQALVELQSQTGYTPVINYDNAGILETAAPFSENSTDKKTFS